MCLSNSGSHKTYCFSFPSMRPILEISRQQTKQLKIWDDRIFTNLHQNVGLALFCDQSVLDTPDRWQRALHFYRFWPLHFGFLKVSVSNFAIHASRSVFFSVNCYRRDHFLISQLSHFRVQININIANLSKNTLPEQKTPLWGLVRRYENQKTFPVVFPSSPVVSSARSAPKFSFFPWNFSSKTVSERS